MTHRLGEFTAQTHDVRKPRRALVCFRAESIEAKVDYTTWLNAWRSKLTFVSRDRGCGCCIHLFNLEGTTEAIEALPDSLTSLMWTEKTPPSMTPPL